MVPAKPTSGTLRLELALTNEDSKPVKVCTACLPGHTPIKVLADGTHAIQVFLGPDRSESDMQTAKGVANSIVTLQPGSSVKIPFNLFPNPHTTARVTVHYAVPKRSDRIDGAEYEFLDMWRGIITAEPLVIRVDD